MRNKHAGCPINWKTETISPNQLKFGSVLYNAKLQKRTKN